MIPTSSSSHFETSSTLNTRIVHFTELVLTANSKVQSIVENYKETNLLVISCFGNDHFGINIYVLGTQRGKHSFRINTEN